MIIMGVIKGENTFNSQASGGTGASGSGGAGGAGTGSVGRTAVYYYDSFSASFTPDYLKDVNDNIVDALFSDDFEKGNLTAWDASVIDVDDLSAAGYADFYGYWGMQAVIDDTTSIYVQDNFNPSEPESRYRARFYFDPNSLTMASGDILDLLVTSGTTTDYASVQLRDNAGTYEIRVGVLNDSASWTDSAWYAISDAWTAIEIDWMAASAAAANDGYLTLWLDGTSKETLSSVDNDTHELEKVMLGTQGIESGTSGTLYFDDFVSRRISYIGTLASPYTPPETPVGASWEGHSYDYDDPALCWLLCTSIL